MEIQKEEFLNKLDASRYGTGSIADEIGVESDTILALIENGEGNKELISDLKDVLEDWENRDEKEEESGELEDKTVSEIKSMVQKGALEEEKVLSFEKSKDEKDKRVTLIDWLE